MDPKSQIQIRMYVVLTLLGVIPLFVGAQIGWIYVTEGQNLQTQGERQARTSVEIPAMRGSILDREGRALAINTARYDLALDPTVEGFTERDAMFFDSLSTLTGTPPATYRRRVQERSSPQYVRLLRGLTAEQRDRIADWDLPGVILTPRFARRYNYGTTAAHVLGHVGSDGEGLAGLELQYDKHLQGTPGRRAVKRDRHGNIKAFVGGKVVEPEHGEHLRLTIDLVRQSVLEDELARGVKESGAAWGTAVAMDPTSGAILAMANVPTYNPNRPGQASNAARRNRAITDRFEPGSTFKLVGAAAAVEQDIIQMDDTVDTGDGWAVFHGHTMKDVHAYGRIPFRDVIAHSSNVGMAKTVQQLDRGTFFQYARNLGFGHPTSIDLPGEVDGVLKRPPEWSQTTLTSMAIGYEVAATPLQILTAYSALANGGLLVEPHVVAERQTFTGETTWTQTPDSIRRALRRSTTETLRPAFERVVEEGTATEAQIKGLRVAGKTGTALSLSEQGAYDSEATRATFVGFLPADDPDVALLVMVGRPQSKLNGGVVAAPIFRRIARRWANTFPDVVNRIATHRDTTQAARAERTAETADAAPTASARWRTADALPDLTGLSARQAAQSLRARDVRVTVNGTGTVVAQTPAPGRSVPNQATLRCR